MSSYYEFCTECYEGINPAEALSHMIEDYGIGDGRYGSAGTFANEYLSFAEDALLKADFPEIGATKANMELADALAEKFKDSDEINYDEVYYFDLGAGKYRTVSENTYERSTAAVYKKMYQLVDKETDEYINDENGHHSFESYHDAMRAASTIAMEEKRLVTIVFRPELVAGSDTVGEAVFSEKSVADGIPENGIPVHTYYFLCWSSEN